VVARNVRSILLLKKRRKHYATTIVKGKEPIWYHKTPPQKRKDQWGLRGLQA
jgi:hypothetical protein